MEDYKQQVFDDLQTHANENQDTARELLAGDEDARRDYLTDAYNTDSITGNATGSYYCNAYKAQEQIDRTGILWEEDFLGWLNDMCLDLGEQLKRGAETVDVLARCWALETMDDAKICEALRAGLED